MTQRSHIAVALARGLCAATALCLAPVLVTLASRPPVPESKVAVAPATAPPQQAIPPLHPLQAMAPRAAAFANRPPAVRPGRSMPDPASEQVDNPFCAMPQAQAGEKVVLVGSYEATVSADVSLAGGEQTFVGDVTVEPGTEPLYVVLTSYSSMVWRFTGAVDRVRNVVATTHVRSPNGGVGADGAGVTGIAADRVAFLGSPRCLKYFSEYGSIDHAVTAGAVSRRTGREPDAAAGIYALTGVSIPSMRMSAARERRWGKTEAIHVDPAAVVSAKAAEVLDVLPGDAGLDQLVKQGALVQMSSGHRSYRIVKTFSRFPAGLYGGDRADFLLAKGVAMPGGDLGHSCLVVVETGLPVPGAVCIGR